ncbi:hypothetical protein Egran_01201 [Elaphomyces granulatus]|uniref:PQ loop repeat protein n=1 Tax=Elaphomyces granulatus TaxID=519963 RepID=A0A232M3P7_9EURO|nr:hypothetical protein Egran_01201 [Elaphomyces granulatus]
MGDGNQIPLAANVLGTIGTVLWCIQLVPQIWHNWKYKKTEGLPASMMLLWASCAVPFGIYMILQVGVTVTVESNFKEPTLISNVIEETGARSCSTASELHTSQFTDTKNKVLTPICHSNYSLVKVIMVVAGACLLCGSIEALFIFTLRIPYDKGVTWPALLIGVIAAILLILGLIPPYFELWKRDGRVVGFSWVFLSIDCLGAFFSILALAAQSSFDILGGILYISVIVLEAGIFASHIIWRIRHRKLLRAAKEAGKTVDEMLESMEGECSTNSPPGDLESGRELDSQHQEKSSPKPGD